MNVIKNKAPPGAPPGEVGRPVRRTDAPAKAAGATRYAGDFAMPGMLHARVLRSPVAAGRLRGIDAGAARALPGVACVLSAKDIPGAGAVCGRPVLAAGSIRHYGEPIALIAARSPAIAELAMAMMVLDIEETAAVFDPSAALAPGAPGVHGEGNVSARHRIRKGDLEAGFAAAEMVVERTYRVGRMEHAFLEPEAGIAWLDEDGVLTIRVGTQMTDHYRAVAEVLALPPDKVRVLGMFTGGAFGGKESVTIEAFLGLLAQATGRPVRLACAREESFLTHGQRHAMSMTYRSGITRDGRITAHEVDIVADGGAHPAVNRFALFHAGNAAAGPYRIDAIHVDAVAAATNTPPAEALRSFGAGLACVAYEAQMDEIAKALGMSPLEVRRRNFLARNQTTATGQAVESAVWTGRCMDRAWRALGDRTPDAPPLRIGRGIACYQQFYGRIATNPESAEAAVAIEADGSVTVRTCVPDIGGGQVSALCQIAAEVLGVALGRVRIEHTDSAALPAAGATGVSAQLYMSGNAVKMAAERLLARADPEAPGSASAVYRAPVGAIDPDTGQGFAYPDFTYGAHAVELAVDVETGEVAVLKSVGCHDVGRAVNPAAVAGQIEGGAVMGLGCALSEEFKLQRGRPATPSLGEYLIPTAIDVPGTNQAIILESASGLGPFGAKGIAEAAFTPVAPAIANAVAEAIGVRIFELPITPEKIVKALRG